jgi:hypothetical protein
MFVKSYLHEFLNILGKIKPINFHINFDLLQTSKINEHEKLEECCMNDVKHKTNHKVCAKLNHIQQETNYSQLKSFAFDVR